MSRREYWKDEADRSSRGSVVLLWMAEIVVLFMELLGFGEIYETVTDFVKPKTRPMLNWEQQLARTIFGNTIDYQQVRIDESAYIGPKQYLFCYVSFNIINSWHRMPNHILMHELMHVWQYQRMGAIYMIRALIAQHTEMGYDYGGIAAIKEKMASGETLFDFNFEQQADVITDCFLMQQGYAPQWGTAQLEDLIIYQSFIQPILLKTEEDNLMA